MRSIRATPVYIKRKPGELRTDDRFKVLTDIPYSPLFKKKNTGKV